MTTYTLQKEPNNTLCLLTQDGTRYPCTQLLQDAGERRVIALDAKMGAGKTTLVKQLLDEMGTKDVVNSPTFAIVNVYEAQGADVYHFDCYRLKDIREAIDFGAEEYLYSGNWCLVEWPDIITPLLPENTMWISIEVKEDGMRRLTIND